MARTLALALVFSVALAACDPPAPLEPRAPSEAGASDPLGRLEARRRALAHDLALAKDGAARSAVLRRAASTLEQALVDEVLPRWDGTAWAFHGTSTTPREGAIACGYFVSTTLREAGLGVERIRLAQQASERIVKTLSPKEHVQRFSDVPVEEFVAAVARRGDGLYVVGLDDHVGYLVVRGGVVFFHHASYVGARKVVRELAVEAKPLVKSRYRVVGKLFADDRVVEAWLLGTPIPTSAA
ncbi:MAG: hypothetical protein IPJ34_15960 [Myxococcales bacterium]|nr:hypothetical protein [Myxococcales bacterium]